MRWLTDRPAWTRHLPLPERDFDVLAGESLPRVWRQRWQESPGAVAFVNAAGLAMTNEQLEERSRQVAGRLARAGIGPGDRVIYSGRASIDYVVSYVAAHRLGVAVVPVNTGYTYGEVSRIVDNTTPRGAVVDSPEMGEIIQTSSKGQCRVFRLPIDGPGERDVPLDEADRHTPALICHTSGTTGVSKGAVLTSGNLLASAEAVRVAWRWTADDRLLLALPLFHLHGLGVGIHGTLTAGASALLYESFDATVMADAVAQAKGSLFFGVPTMYRRIADSGKSAAFSRLRLCVSGSAPLPAELHSHFAALSGQAILERYGMTETVMNVSNPYEGERRAGTVGFPLPGVDVRLDATFPGGPGEIELKGPNVFGGYWNMESATASTFTADGWFRSGDIGQWDPDGYLRIVGRSKELIISGGYNVYPREVEDALLQHPGVHEVAVVGRPSEQWGETVVAFVVPAGSADGPDLMTFAAERLASYKRPRRIEFVDELPRNALGKVMRDQL